LTRGLLRGADGIVRCAWSGTDPLYQAYHDTEWGFPVADDRRLYEKICLEGFQAGLSWITILRKREAFRRAFDGFDAARVARFTPARVERLLGDADIVRHRGKIESTINNAARALELAKQEGSLAAFLWRHAPAPPARARRLTWDMLRKITTAAESVALSRELKRRGWTFVGPTTLYAFMQSVGFVNDHIDGCPTRGRAAAARGRFEIPT
jgi:DNA-3-methyladenine glycosylase I